MLFFSVYFQGLGVTDFLITLETPDRFEINVLILLFIVTIWWDFYKSYLRDVNTSEFISQQEETGENMKFEKFSEMSNCFVYCCLLCWCVATGTQFCGLANVFFSARWRFGTFHRGITKPFFLAWRACFTEVWNSQLSSLKNVNKKKKKKSRK